MLPLLLASAPVSGRTGEGPASADRLTVGQLRQQWRCSGSSNRQRADVDAGASARMGECCRRLRRQDSSPGQCDCRRWLSRTATMLTKRAYALEVSQRRCWKRTNVFEHNVAERAEHAYLIATAPPEPQSPAPTAGDLWVVHRTPTRRTGITECSRPLLDRTRRWKTRRSSSTSASEIGAPQWRRLANLDSLLAQSIGTGRLGLYAPPTLSTRKPSETHKALGRPSIAAYSTPGARTRALTSLVSHSRR